MSGWGPALCQLEQVDYELMRITSPPEAGPWLQRRASILRRIAELPPSQAGRLERVRLAAAAARGRELEARWQLLREQMREEAGELHSSQVLLRALRPAPRPPHLTFHS